MEDVCTAPWYCLACKEVSPYDLLQRKHVVKLVLKNVSIEIGKFVIMSVRVSTKPNVF